MALLVWQVLEKEICIRNIKIGLYKIQMEMPVCKSTRKIKNTVRKMACIGNQVWWTVIIQTLLFTAGCALTRLYQSTVLPEDLHTGKRQRWQGCTTLYVLLSIIPKTKANGSYKNMEKKETNKGEVVFHCLRFLRMKTARFWGKE